MSYFWSSNGKDRMALEDLGMALPIDEPPFYYIDWKLKNGTKPRWEYSKKSARDKDIELIKTERNKKKPL